MKIEWSSPEWSYMLGVIHGDGSIAPRSISISVGYKDADYAAVLVRAWKRLGFSPKTYRARSALRLDVHSAELRRAVSRFKVSGRWAWPKRLSVPDYLAGVVDTDGCVTTPGAKRIVIVLKRSGNLRRLAPMFASVGIRRAPVKNLVSQYGGKDYEIEQISLTGMDRIVAFSNVIRLRHPRKAVRLAEMRRHVDEIQARVPLWRSVGLWLQEEPRTWEEIARRFKLSKPQVDSVLGNLKLMAELKVIPPPKALARYRVSGL